MASLTQAILDEIKRKAGLGIPLTDPTPEKSALYKQYQQQAAAPKASAPSPPPLSQTPAGAQSSIPTGSQSSTSEAARAARQKEYENFTGWDNNPDVKKLQQKWLQIYVETGRKDTAEQNALHAQAEQIRRYNNPMYPGSPAGPGDWIEAEKIYPRATTPNADGIESGLDGTIADPANWGGYLKMGIGVFFLVFLMSMFRK